MTIPVLILTALALSMDAFAASISCGISGMVERFTDKLKISISFGVFQGVMPLLGFLLASTFSKSIESIDHWIAFVLLGFIGGKMILESRQCETIRKEKLDIRRILILSIATSIDAMATGVGFALLNINIFYACIFISVITFILSMVGAYFGNVLGCRFKQKAELLGGIVLILIGTKILIEHLFGL